MRAHLGAAVGAIALAATPLSAQVLSSQPGAVLVVPGYDADAHLPPVPAWENGAPIQLMVVREINSRDVHAGDRVRLRVNAPVMIGGQVAIAVGAWAWAEIISSSETGAAGGKGRIALRLLNVETPWGPVAISGTTGAEGKSNTAGVVLGMLAFGPLGLLTKGGNASFKAGDLITAHIDLGDTAPARPATPTSETY